MALYEIETDGHIVITWAEDEETARQLVSSSFPHEEVRRLMRRPRDSWVISKSALGIVASKHDPCAIARSCLQNASGDKMNAVRLYMSKTGNDLETARKAIESNMVMGW